MRIAPLFAQTLSLVDLNLNVTQTPAFVAARFVGDATEALGGSTISSMPEPGTVLLLGFGRCGLVAVARRNG